MVNGLILVLVTLAMITQAERRVKRAHDDKFNTLLNLYKMNPLKQSKVFKAFSSSVLLPNWAGQPMRIQNEDSIDYVNGNDNTKGNVVEVKFIEEMIHVTHPPKNIDYEQPDYKIPANKPEKFLDEFEIHNYKSIKEVKFNNKIEIEKNNEKLPVTKMLPVGPLDNGEELMNLENAEENGIPTTEKNEEPIYDVIRAEMNDDINGKLLSHNTLHETVFHDKEIGNNFREEGIIVMR